MISRDRGYLLLEFDKKYRDKGFCGILGIDEAGRGPLAGAVVVAGVVLNPEIEIKGLDDSKKINPKRRINIANEIIEKAFLYKIFAVNEYIINKINILNATLWGMRAVCEELSGKYDIVLVDGDRAIPYKGIRQEAIIKGDSQSASIAAASILAKVARDELMERYNEKYPNYEFLKHKGYGTKLHIDLLNKFGPSMCHRIFYKPVWASLYNSRIYCNYNN